MGANDGDAALNEWTIHEDSRERAEICRMLCERVVELEDEREQAKAWAGVWKRAAKYYRRQRDWWEERAWEELQRRVMPEVAQGIQRGKREIHLRAALDGLLRCSAYREFGHCGQCEQRARAALKETAHDSD